jgi:hypothetical protein
MTRSEGNEEGNEEGKPSEPDSRYKKDQFKGL